MCGRSRSIKSGCCYCCCCSLFPWYDLVAVVVVITLLAHCMLYSDYGERSGTTYILNHFKAAPIDVQASQSTLRRTRWRDQCSCCTYYSLFTERISKARDCGPNKQTSITYHIHNMELLRVLPSQTLSLVKTL